VIALLVIAALLAGPDRVVKPEDQNVDEIQWRGPGCSEESTAEPGTLCNLMSKELIECVARSKGGLHWCLTSPVAGNHRSLNADTTRPRPRSRVWWLERRVGGPFKPWWGPRS
jgi:hypothetical protein